MLREFKEPQNPFLILLLTEFIKDETLMVFNKNNAKNIESYVAIPRTPDQTTVASILSAEINQDSVEGAYSAVHWTITQGGFKHTQSMLDKIARRLTFYCRVNSYKEFEKKYWHIAEEFEHFKDDPISDTQLSSIQKHVHFFFRDEAIFLEQSGIKDGVILSNIIKLPNNYIVRSPQIHELQLWDVFGFNKGIEQIEIGVRLRSGPMVELSFVLINPFNNIVGTLKLLNCEVLGFMSARNASTVVALADKDCKLNAFFIEEINVKHEKLTQILFIGLPKVIHKFKPVDVLNPVLFLIAKVEKFESLCDLYGFSLFTDYKSANKTNIQLLTNSSLRIIANISTRTVSLQASSVGSHFYWCDYNDLRKKVSFFDV